MTEYPTPRKDRAIQEAVDLTSLAGDVATALGDTLRTAERIVETLPSSTIGTYLAECERIRNQKKADQAERDRWRGEG